MTQVTVAAPRQQGQRGCPVLSATIDVDGDRHNIYIRSSQGPLTDAADPFVALALLPAMRLGAPLHIAGPISPRLLKHLDQIQAILATWNRDLSTVPVSVAAQVHSAPPTARGTGCFFSGGVDSSYSALQHQNEITHLILVHGFDVPTGASPLWRKIAAHIGDAAAQLHKPLIEVETNARALLDIYATWDTQANGAALASVALALAPQLQTVYIAGAYPYDVLLPGGSHPLLDLLWSNEHVEIIHDAGPANRWQKLEQLVASGTALSWLRVCWHNTDGAYNCGICRKCLAVMAYLEAAGARQRCPTFTRTLDLGALASQPVDGPGILYLRQTLLAAVERLGTHPEIADAIRTSINQPSPDPRGLGDYGGLGSLQRIADLEAETEKAERRLCKLRARLRHMEQSRSWRLTAPLRRAADLARQLHDKKET